MNYCFETTPLSLLTWRAPVGWAGEHCASQNGHGRGWPDFSPALKKTKNFLIKLFKVYFYFLKDRHCFIFHCVGGCWRGLTEDFCEFGIDSLRSTNRSNASKIQYWILQFSYTFPLFLNKSLNHLIFTPFFHYFSSLFLVLMSLLISPSHLSL